MSRVLRVEHARAIEHRTISNPERQITMSVAETIRNKLTEALSPDHLEVIDESHLHAGHIGARPEGETHFKVVVTSSSFQGVSRVESQRQIYRILADELAGPVHALSVRASAE
jgi:BolA family transcriptional regulator, general stress-responsive regulator